MLLTELYERAELTRNGPEDDVKRQATSGPSPPEASLVWPVTGTVSRLASSIYRGCWWALIINVILPPPPRGSATLPGWSKILSVSAVSAMPRSEMA